MVQADMEGASNPCPSFRPSSPQGAAEGEDVVLLKGGGFRRRHQRGPGGDVGQVENSQYVELALKET